MRGELFIGVPAIVLGVLGTGCRPASAGQEATAKPTAAIAVWDTGRPSAEPLTSKALTAHDGWNALAAGEKGGPFKGDAVITNGRAIAVVRQSGHAVEMYTVGKDGPSLRVRLQLLTTGGEPADRPRAVG